MDPIALYLSVSINFRFNEELVDSLVKALFNFFDCSLVAMFQGKTENGATIKIGLTRVLKFTVCFLSNSRFF